MTELKMGHLQDSLNQALQLHQSGRIKEAINLYRELIRNNEENAQLNFLLGTGYLQLEKYEQGLRYLDRVLGQYPAHTDVLVNRGIALKELGRCEEAVASFDKAIMINPSLAEAFSNRGNALKKLKRYEEAVQSYDGAIKLKPDYADAYMNRSAALRDLRRLDEALTSADFAISLNNHDPEAYTNRALALQALKRPDDALDSYERALALKPDYAETYWNKSLLFILLGRYLEGWALYEWRFQVRDLKDNYYNFQKLAWRGREDIRGKKLLIYAEQGLGDVIQFCRYVPQIKTLGVVVILEVPKSMVTFISTLKCEMTIVEKGRVLPEFDAYCPMMSLPYAFKTTVDTIPMEMPYLSSDAKKVEKWHERLTDRKHLKVGLVWSGSATHNDDAHRSIRLRELLPLMDLPVEWHSLQKEYRQHDLEVLNLHPEIHQHQNELNDFSETAALIDCLDLVITVDTSVAHVAGAIGKPVWILLPFVPDYRWMLDREDSPWYPTAKLLRQPAVGDWRSVVEAVKYELGRCLTPDVIEAATL